MTPKKALWYKRAKEVIDEERRLRFEEKGYKPLWYPPVGETTIHVDPNIPPRTVETRRGTREVIRIYIEGEALDWMINPNSPVWRQILEGLCSNITKIKVVRAGEGKQTRMSVIKVEEPKGD